MSILPFFKSLVFLVRYEKIIIAGQTIPKPCYQPQGGQNEILDFLYRGRSFWSGASRHGLRLRSGGLEHLPHQRGGGKPRGLQLFPRPSRPLGRRHVVDGPPTLAVTTTNGRIQKLGRTFKHYFRLRAGFLFNYPQSAGKKHINT